MKLRQFLFIASFLVSSFSLSALELSIDSYSFCNIEKSQPYLDTYIRVLGSSIGFQSVAGGKQASVNITITLEQSGEIKAYDKYLLNSPLSAEPSDFIGLKRFAVPAGNYAVHIIAVDAADESNKLELKQFVTIDEVVNQPTVADIQLLGKAKSESTTGEANPMVKHGIYMEPLTFSFVGDEYSELLFFTEFYNVASLGYIKYGINEGYDDAGVEAMAKYKKVEVGAALPLVLSLPVDKLKSGKYHLTVKLYDIDKNEVASSKADFIRQNTEYDKEYWTNYDDTVENSFVDSIAADDLRYHLLAILPIAKQPYLGTLQLVLDLKNETAQRHFLLDFWRDQSASYPNLAFKKYMEVAKLVDYTYNDNVGYGFQTDRGHLFLKYGKPNNVISIDNEPDAYPYEIWYYNTLDVTRQTEVRFIFYNPTLAGNNYELLHGTCIGERNNPAWEVELYRRALDSQIGATIEATEVKAGWNRRAKEYFNNF